MDGYAKSTSINDLPPKVLASIFEIYAESEGTAGLYTVLAKVSTAWRKIALNPSLWIEVSFSADDFCDGQSWLNDEDILDRISSVKSLHFNYIPTVQESANSESLIVQALEQILKNSRSLENFNLEFCQGTPIPQVLFDLPTLCPKITGIQIEQMSCMSKKDLFLTWIEKYNTKLTKLILHSVFFLYVPLPLLSQKIAKFCPNLSNFHLDLVSSNDVLDLNSIQAGCPKIRELCLKNLAFTDNDDLTSCFRHLEKFCFKPLPFPANKRSVARDILRALREAEDLKEIELIDINLNSKTMLKLPCKSLKKLRFQHQGDNADALYRILYRWKHSLTELDVPSNEKALDSLFRYIERYGKDNLESLTLQDYIMSTDQLKIIARLCPKLKCLCFSYIRNMFPEKMALTSREKINEWLNY